MQFSASRAMTIRRIEGGIFGNLTDIDTTITPFEAGLGYFVNMDKDFIGKDALIKKDKRTCLFGITCKTVVPKAGSKIKINDKQVGYITAGVPSPTLQQGIGYVRFYEPNDYINKEIEIILPDNSSHTGVVVDLPFYDKEKKIVKGIDRSIPIKPDSNSFDAK